MDEKLRRSCNNSRLCSMKFVSPHRDSNFIQVIVSDCDPRAKISESDEISVPLSVHL